MSSTGQFRGAMPRESIWEKEDETVHGRDKTIDRQVEPDIGGRMGT
jgi:hypothetical protein